jgi:hypothetical protein
VDDDLILAANPADASLHAVCCGVGADDRFRFAHKGTGDKQLGRWSLRGSLPGELLLWRAHAQTDVLRCCAYVVLAVRDFD